MVEEVVVADDAESGVDGDELDGVVGGVADEGSLNGEGLRGRGMLWASRTAPAVDATEETGGGRRCRLQDKVEVIAVGRARLPLAAARAGADEKSCARHGIVVAKARLVAMAGGGGRCHTVVLVVVVVVVVVVVGDRKKLADGGTTRMQWFALRSQSSYR